MYAHVKSYELKLHCDMQMGKGYAGQANKAGNKADAASICEEGFKQVESVYL